MSRVSKMSMKDILDQMDLIMKENDIAYICDDVNVIEEFLEKYANNVSKSSQVKQFFIDNERYIDKEKLVLLAVRNYQEDIERLEKIKNKIKIKMDANHSEEIIEQLTDLVIKIETRKERLEKAKRIGKGMNACLTFYYFDEKENRFKIEVVDSREVIDGKKIDRSKAIKKFEKIESCFKDKGGDGEEELDMEFILQSILLTDLFQVFPDEQFGNDIRTMILENEILKSKIKTPEELEAIKTKETYGEYVNLLDGVYFDGILTDVKLTLKDYAEYIDFDKLLLISAYRFKERLEEEAITKEQSLGVREILKIIANNLESPSSKMKCKLQKRRDSSYDLEDVEFSIEDLKKCISQFTSEGYLAEQRIEEYREKVFRQDLSLLQIAPECLDIMFSSKELEELALMSEENLVYACFRLKWDSEKVFEGLKEIKKCSVEGLKSLNEHGKLSEENLIELYELDIIPLEYIQELKEDIDLSGNISFEKLNEYYEQLKEEPENEELLKRYNRYSSLYKEILMSNEEKSNHNSNEVMEQLIGELEGKEYEDTLEHYYKDGIITLESIAEWNNEDIITLLFDDGLIDLEDLKGLVVKQKLPFDYLTYTYEYLIEKEDIEYDEKMELLRSGFVSEGYIVDLFLDNLIFENDFRQLAEENIIRKEEMQRIIDGRTMEELESHSDIRLTGLNTLTKKSSEDRFLYGYTGDINTDEEKKVKLIIDPKKREEFISLLNAYRADTDLKAGSPFFNYDFYVIPDESGGIGLNSVVIAERYYEDKYLEERVATNNATYFFKYKDLMVLSKLRKSEMTKEREGIVFTANHNIAKEGRAGSWAKSVISCLAKTMLSSDLKEYSKKEQRAIILQKLKEVYDAKEFVDILEMAKKIDEGEYICQVEEEKKSQSRKRKSAKKSFEDSDEGR